MFKGVVIGACVAAAALPGFASAATWDFVFTSGGHGVDRVWQGGFTFSSDATGSLILSDLTSFSGGTFLDDMPLQELHAFASFGLSDLTSFSFDPTHPYDVKFTTSPVTGSYTSLGPCALGCSASASLKVTGKKASGSFEGLGSFSVPLLGAPGPFVPEPATWAMMLAGFGLTGAALRRRQSTKVSYMA